MSPSPTPAEKRRQQTDERRRAVAATLVTAPDQASNARMSFLAETFTRAFPQDLVERGLISRGAGQVPLGLYHPSLLAANPQRGRVVDRELDVLAESLNRYGQQEPIVARLITKTDRARWPKHFTETQLLLILKGHRIFFAQPKSTIELLRVELMLPMENEDDLSYSRRALQRASIKLMHSQGYDIFDKVNQYDVWRQEFALEQPKDTDVAAYFDISRSEAQRLKIVANLDQKVAQEIINGDYRPADEVIVAIANRPPEEQRQAYKHIGQMTVAEVRKFLKEERPTPPESAVTGAGRPRNFVLAIKDQGAPITFISTGLTAAQWKRRGGAKAFWTEIRNLVNRKEIQERLSDDLG
ncbi:MAG TPA: hypothetical protein VMV10_18995 [Pirellulales bacterium]|nr:hypothetical protein [Pirellulales bacterium]